MAKAGELIAAAQDAAGGTRAKLLSAGLAVFAERGFAGATTREIAQRAGVFQPQIAYFFTGKEQLWREAMDFALSRSDAVIDAVLAVPSTSLTERRADLVRAYLGFAARNPEWAKLVLQEGLHDGGRGEWLVETWLRPRSNKLLHALTGCDLDKLRGQAARQAISLLGILTGAILIFSQGDHVADLAGIDSRDGDFLETHIDLTTRAVEAAAQALNGDDPA